mmetsp:Transcript_34003/g.89429  ORF Transcript_34003/g.89429 Transcript_34003/m.89429 type:complete len:86 (+) Transcript_34003:411-668(+)
MLLALLASPFLPCERPTSEAASPAPAGMLSKPKILRLDPELLLCRHLQQVAPRLAIEAYDFADSVIPFGSTLARKADYSSTCVVG